MPRTRKINLALGGGGAKGYAHIGVIQAFTELGIEIQSIVGTSIGALIGALFAYDRSITYGSLSFLEGQKGALESTREFCLHLDLSNYASFAWGSLFGKKCIANIEELESVLLTQFRSPDYANLSGIRMRELAFDLSITLTDAQTGDPIVVDRCRAGTTTLASAVRASISVPILFDEARIEIAGRTHLAWDGGLSGNCRFDIACQRNGAIPTFGSTVTYRGEPRQSRNTSYSDWFELIEHINSVFLRNFENLTLKSMSEKQRQNLIIVRPEFGDVRSLSFDLSRDQKLELFKNGRQATLDEMSKCPGFLVS